MKKKKIALHTGIKVEAIAPGEKGIVAVVENSGNVNLKTLSVDFTGVNDDGEEIFAAQSKPWYILQGGKRTFITEIPQGACEGSSEVRVVIQTDKIALKNKIFLLSQKRNRT